jgi:hypothetical protein
MVLSHQGIPPLRGQRGSSRQAGVREQHGQPALDLVGMMAQASAADTVEPVAPAESDP